MLILLFLFSIGIFAVIILLLLKIDRLTDRVVRLERKMSAAEKSAMDQTPAAAPPAPLRTTSEAQTAERTLTAPPIQVRPSPASPAAEPPHSAAPAPQPPPSRTREELEAFVGGKLLNRIGALALVIGVGFFLKYAFDNNWISEAVRVAIGFAAGIGLILVGMRTHNRGLAIFAQGLFGAGLSVLYLSAFASFNFYHLLPQVPAFVVMSVVTALGFAVAVQFDSLVIAILAWAGGFLTPFLLSTGSANAVGLFSYITLLEAGLLAMVVKRPAWTALTPLTLLGTYCVFLLWKEEYYSDADLTVALVFSTLFWGMLAAVCLREILRGAPSSRSMHQLVGLFNAGSFYLILVALIDPHHHEWMGAASLALSFLYFLQALFIQRAAGDTRAVAQNHVAAMLLLVFATAVQWSGFTTVALWSLEAAALIWASQRWKMYVVAAFSSGLLACAAIKCASTSGAFGFVPLGDFVPFLNLRAAAYLVLAVSTFASALQLRRSENSSLRQISEILHSGWTLVLFIFITVEVNDLFLQRTTGQDSTTEEHIGYLRFLAVACAWMVYSLPLVYAGVRKDFAAVAIPGFLITAMSLCFALLLGISYAPIEQYIPVFNARAGVLIVIAAGLFMQSRWIARSSFRQDWREAFAGVVSVAAILLILTLLTAETRDAYELRIFNARLLSSGIEEATAQLENLKQLSLSGLWMVYGGVLMGVGLWRRERGLRFVAIALLGIAILKIFIYDLSFLEALYRIFSFVGLGLILLAASYVYQKYKSVLIEDRTEHRSTHVE